MIIAALSTVVEWYDFTLYLYFSSVLARIFFGGGAGALGVVLLGFAVSYLMRPLGALALGHFGDRHGRRRAMMLSMAVMTAAMAATALLPTYATAGAGAGWALLGLRCVMAFAVGGEYTGVIAYLLEGSAPERRGLVTSLASAASEVGALLAAGVAAVTVGAMDSATLSAWGWRIPFLVGAGLAGAILLARSVMEESPEYEAHRDAGRLPDSPLRHAATHHRAGIARGFAISALGSITYYVGIGYVPAFLGGVGALGEGVSLWLSTIAAFAVIAVTPVVGALSDRVGRRPVLIAVTVASAMLPAAMFAIMARGDVALALTGAVVLACLGGAVSAVGAVAVAEQVPGEARLSGLAFGFTSATAVFGGLTPWVAQALVARTGAAWVPGAMIAVVAVVLLPVLARVPETAPRFRQMG